MNSDLIKEIASEVAAQTISQNLGYYFVFGAITLIASWLGAYLGAYTKKRAEQKAISADFTSIKQQLKETTTLSESIKTDIQSFSERSERIKWLKQEKLEQFMLAALDLSDYFIAKAYYELYDKEQPTLEDPWKKIIMLQVIYLPELSLETNRLGSAASQFQDWIARGMQERATHLKTTGKLGATSSAHASEFTAHINSMNTAVIDLQKSAYKTAEQLMTIQK